MTSSDSQDVLRSSQSFVRTLKSQADPPHENGPSKILIARQGWDSPSLYVPRKADFLLEWIMTRFNKEKFKRSLENPLIDPAHWLLLADILSCPDDVHIVPLLMRVSVPGIVSSFLALYPLASDTSKASLLPPVLRSLKVLWPLAVKRAGIDPLSECLWTSLSVLDQTRESNEWDNVVDVFVLLFTAFREAFDSANVNARKKVYLALVQHQLHPWLRAILLFPSPHPLHDQLYSVGVKILLNPDNLRISLETSPNSNTCTDIFSTLFGPSIKSTLDSHVTFLDILPRLTKSYFMALRKFCSTIDTSTQQPEKQARNAAKRFQNFCLDFLKDSGEVPDLVAPIWVTRVGVLAVIESEAVFDYAETDILDKVRELASKAISVLDEAWDRFHSSLVTHALDILACLHRIEPDIIIPLIPQLLERLATCSDTVSHSSITLLSQLISYHSKTRTLHSFMSLLLSSAASPFSFMQTSSAGALYRIVECSPLVSLSFMDELAHSLGAFVTPGQQDNIVSTVHSALESTISAGVTFGQPSRKRRKVAGIHGTDVHNEGAEYNAVKFVLVARLSAVALIAVLDSSAKGDDAHRRNVCLGRIDNMISGALRTLVKTTERPEVGKTPKKRKTTHETHEEHSSLLWCQECSLATLLRLWYDLFERSNSPGIGTEGDITWETPRILDDLQNEFVRSLRDYDADPELQLEIGRVLFARGRPTPQENATGEKEWPAIDEILDYIESRLFECGLATPFNPPAERSALFSPHTTALALWDMTLERHLSAVDMYASPAQLERVIDLMIRARPCSHDTTFAGSIASRAMATAGFWEFANIRTSFLAVLDKQTGEFGSMDVQKWLFSLVHEDTKALKVQWKISNKSLDDFKPSIEVYRLLHYFPSEYFSRISRLELAKRALAADVQVRVLARKKEHNVSILSEWRTVLRSFVVMIAGQTQTKVLEDTASVQHWMPYLTLAKYAPDTHNEPFVSSTLSLLSLIYMPGLRMASWEGKEQSLTHILSYFLTSNPFLNNRESLAQQSLLRFLRILASEFKASSFSADIQSLFRRLCMDLDVSLKPAISATVEQKVASKFLETGHVIEAWHVLLSFKQWLLINPGVDMFGEMILRKTACILSSPDGLEVTEGFRANVLSLLIQQVKMLPQEDCQHIETVAAAYVLFTRPRNTDGITVRALCDRLIAQASKTLSVIKFGAFLDLVAEAIESSSGQRSWTELEILLHLSKLLLHEAPERTSKLTHEHSARCLRVFVNRPDFTGGSSMLALQVLEFIHLVCIEHSASLKISDVACLWSILHRMLTGCAEHDDSTSHLTFQTIVSIVGALLRLRRDLVSLHLPQLSMILRQLISLIRGVRPLLGTKQHRLISDKFPKWINPTHSLGKNEANALARVLTDLTTKSLVRTHSLSANQKAESLARPFRRHAPYVLLAYIQLMNDPLSVLSMHVRRELEPGLFALCGIMGEHGRDTLMVQSLDVGGKALFKSLWKEYDKQKYVGGG